MFTYVFIEKDVSDSKGRIGENAQPGKSGNGRAAE